jgi:hypothetical protein
VLVVVGGQQRKVGKTSVVTAIVRAMPELEWTAVKLTSHHHVEEPGKGDTARYLEAGAFRARLMDAASADLTLLAAGGGNIICESTRFPRGRKPDCSLLLINPSQPDWKDAARDFAAHADALVVVGEGEPPSWLGSKFVFRLTPPQWMSAALVQFVRERVTGDRATGT